MLLPLALPVDHIIFFGDHHHVQTFVQSKICKEAGFGTSIYERLQKLVPAKQAPSHQCVQHPLTLKIINTYFYNGRLKCAPNDIALESNKEHESQRLPFSGIMDVPSMESLHSRKGCINSAALFILLQQLSKDQMNLDRKLSVCVVCLSSKEANAVGDQLGTMYEINDRFSLHVRLIGNLEGNLFDVIIISTIVEDDAELNCVSKNSLNVALTSARHCCYMVCRCRLLVNSGGIWKELVKYARALNMIKLVDPDELNEVMQKLENNGVGHIRDPNCVFSRKVVIDRPYGTKYILADVRDKRGQPDTCTFQATCGVVESICQL
ncbi:unnamed protein product [Urochloa decumbens]|uniref:DNA2/NAM7 helicase-like C-terminal domain-containing protein n=1 Tax=Urochloa decumbens TaxID=240449 RepID=A0ABC9BYZ6_9POAL